MNERIRQLALQAGGIYHNDDGDELTPALVGKSLEKFAELIVKECAEQVITGPNGPAHYAVEAALRLKKHFGVEKE